MIIFVAPYSPPNRPGCSHLGASRKIETIISILSNLDLKLVLINSAHNDFSPASITVKDTKIAGVNLVEITPPISSHRAIGKLKNIFCIDRVLSEVEKLGRPCFMWFYNGYAFEMCLASKASQKFHVPMILEFEDWHFSRSRGLNPKPYIDYFFWRKSARLMSGVFAVNAFLASRMRDYLTQVELLPGIVPKVLAEIAQKSLPFSDHTRPVKVGFFGGLSAEKGADIVLKLASKLPVGFEIHVTGTGPLVIDFENYTKKYPERLYYYGRVDDVKLYSLIANCDVMLNPHSPIAEMNNGVFPFKVIEAVASGRLLLSTALPSQELLDVLVGVRFVNHTVDAFYDAIIGARNDYFCNRSLIVQGAYVANKRFGEDAFLKKVIKIVDRFEAMN